MSNVTRNAILEIKIAVNEQAERYHPNTSEFEPILEKIEQVLKDFPEQKYAKIAGKATIKDGAVELVFKVNGKLYPHNETNGELIDAYMHTGDAKHLDQLESELPF